MTGNRFEGKVALVTGAASGIGRATATRLASEGARVMAFDLDKDGLASLAATSDAIQVQAGDVSKRSACQGAVDACVAAFGRLDILGNVAGIARAEHFTSVPEDAYRQMMGVNVDGYFFMAQAAVPHLLEAEGNIVNIASNAALMGQAYTVVYCMTKGAVIQLTRALAMEYINTPLRVNAIAPGGTQTALYDNFVVPEGVDFSLMGRYTALRGSGSAEDIAALLAFVASEEAHGIHGAILSSDRGLTAG
jgi:meso-butanediol dehydrogenase / (S,S)-butanediol dehydrogenase / diacetyl reductase